MRAFIYILTMTLLCAVQSNPVVAGDIPVGAGFTYQGLLEYQGDPANGQFDFFIVLHDTPDLADQLDSAYITDVSVVEGLFTLDLSFDPVHFDGSERWLRIFVNTAGSTQLPGLNPRQRINAVPYAVQSEFALDAPLSTYFGENANGIGYDAGKVEIGGLPASGNSDFQVDAGAGSSPLRIRIGGATKLRVHSNGGTSLGVNDTTVPSNGLLVEGNSLFRGQIRQPLENHGIVKAGIVATCSTASSITRSFNTVGDRSITIDDTIALGAGQCAFTFPFSLDDAYYQVTVQRQNDTRVGSCSNPDATTLICNATTTSGTNLNSIIHVLVY